MALYNAFRAASKWGHFDAESLLQGFGKYMEWNEIDAKWVAQIASTFERAGGAGALKHLPDAAIKASLRAAGLDFDRKHVTFDDPIAYGFPPTTGYADDPVNTASGNFVALESDLPFTGLAETLRFGRVYNSRSDRAGAFGSGWSSWADVRLRPRPEGAEYEGPDGQRAVFARVGPGYGRVIGVNGLVELLDSGLTLRWFDGRRWDFDAEGLPLRASQGPGTEIRLRHDGGRLVELAHACGTFVRLDWDDDRIRSTESSDGRRISYGYDDAGNLTRVDGAEGTRSYGVADDGRLTTITDADGVVEVVNAYDEDGRVLEQLSPFGRRTVYGYLPGHVTVTADEQDGPPNTYVHDQAGRVLAIVDGDDERLSINYDQWGNPVAVTERNGAVTLQEWDEQARPLRRVLPTGAVFTFEYDDAGRMVRLASSTGSITRHVYEGDELSPVETIDPEGGVTRMTVGGGLLHRVVDPDGVEVRFEFDADGNLAAAIDADGNASRIERDAAGRVHATITPLGRRTIYSYDEQGRVAERRDPGGGVWRYDYTPAGRLAGVTDPTGAREETRYGHNGEAEANVDALGHVTSRRYDIFGNVAAVVAEDGATWQLTHDALSRLIATSDPLGGIWKREYDVNGNQTASVDPVGMRYAATYDNAGRVTAISDGTTSSSFDFDELGRTLAHRRPDGSELTAEYDLCGRPVAMIDPAGGTTRIEYTPGGRTRRVIAPSGAVEEYEYDHCGRDVARVDGEGRRWAYRYDADGALVEEVAPGGEVERFTYDAAGRVSEWDAPGQGVTSYAYDDADRVIEITDRDCGTRRFAYDAAGQLASATDANGHTTRYAYNERGWLTEIVDPLGGRTTRTYDDVGRLTTETDPLGRVRSLTYDLAGQLIEEVDGSGRRTRWSYDASGRVASFGPAAEEPITITRDALGREIEIREPGSFTHELRWDREDRLVERRRDGLALRWSYDADGNRAAIGYPDGTQTAYRRDAGGYLVGVEHSSLGAIELQRDPSGRLLAATGNGMHARWEYDGGELRGYEIEAGGRRHTTQLTRDPIGRVVSALIDGNSQRFSYDAAGQLLSATSPGGVFSFTYDANGRLEREVTPTDDLAYEHDRAGQLLVRRSASAPAMHYEYDGSGYRTREAQADVSRQYRWDSLGRLIAVESDEHTTRVEVDALGELAAVDGTPMLWDTADPITPLSWMGDRAVIGLGSPWATSGGGATEWLAPDWQGTVGPSRDPWGASTAPSATTGPRPGYRGEVEFDANTWLRNRVYQPATRAFLQPDPMAPEPGTGWAANPYHYAGNNPLGASDPLGLHPVTDAELQKYRDQMGRTVWDKGADWFKNNWEYVAAGALVAVGAVLIATGVGGPLGLALVSGGLSMAYQKAVNGSVDPLTLALDVLPVGRVLRVGKAALPLLRRGAPLLRRAAGPAMRKVGALTAKLNPRGMLRRVFGGWSGARVRPNPAFPRGREYVEGSHWLFPRRAPVPAWLKNSRWNIKDMWGTDHALADPMRYRFMPRWWKAQHPLPGPVTRFWNRTPIWAQGVAIGGGIGGVVYGAHEVADE